MARLYLVRHGKAAATWDDRIPDPGLNEIGRVQAETMASQLVSAKVVSLQDEIAQEEPRVTLTVDSSDCS
jgi:broad specificity phosphatase PhoE